MTFIKSSSETTATLGDLFESGVFSIETQRKGREDLDKIEAISNDE